MFIISVFFYKYDNDIILYPRDSGHSMARLIFLKSIKSLEKLSHLQKLWKSKIRDHLNRSTEKEMIK